MASPHHTEREDRARVKRQKTNGVEMDTTANQYLAHMYQDEARSNGFKSGEPSPNSPWAGMKRHETTAKQAEKVEDLDTNPFTGEPHSQKYFQILQTRRNLPVNKQRREMVSIGQSYSTTRDIHRPRLGGKRCVVPLDLGCSLSAKSASTSVYATRRRVSTTISRSHQKVGLHESHGDQRLSAITLLCVCPHNEYVCAMLVNSTYDLMTYPMKRASSESSTSWARHYRHWLILLQ